MAKIASESDLDAAVATIVAAFDQDPLWSWMFPDPQLRAEQHDLHTVTTMWREPRVSR